MRFVFSSHATRSLKNSCALAVLAAFSTACSSDFSRLEAYDYASAITPPPQQQRTAYADPQVQNPYPANVDPVTTASVNTRSTYNRPPTPSGYVANHQPSTPQYAQYRPAQPAPAPTVTKNYNTYNTYNTYQTPQKPAVSAARKPIGVDPVVTSSVAKPAPTIQRKPLPLAKQTAAPVQPTPVQAAPVATPKLPEVANSVETPREAGWTATGGTRIAVRDGETLYNISKRYGVPVSALMRVNGISNADQVNAGQQITIPTYVYSSKLGVSAPDNDPKTRASRATRGYLGEVSNSNIAIPTRKPVIGYKPGLAPMTPNLAQTSTGALAHKVVSGDSLGKIAAQNNTTVAALMQVNNLTSSNIRIGQTLKLPTAGQVAQSEAKLPIKPGLAPISTDRVVTGSTQTEQVTPKPYVKPGLAPQKVANLNEEAPSRSGIDTFRWPVTGKVISKFGDKRGDNRNDGIDISVPEGTAVKAAENGLVIYSGNELQEYGKLILVRHEGGWVSAYAHNKSLLVQRGAKIKRGDVIAHSGRTGNAKIPMLHFELRKDSNPVNPQQFLR